MPQVRVVALEVAVPTGVDPAQVVPTLDAAVAGHPGLEVYVELPRDERRPALLAALVGSRHHAKLRTGGVRADLYPDEDELAAAVVACVAAGVAFKATAGLHHAVRNTDPTTGFEQHGFLNVLVAVDAAQRGASTARSPRSWPSATRTRSPPGSRGSASAPDWSGTRSAPSAPAASKTPATS